MNWFKNTLNQSFETGIFQDHKIVINALNGAVNVQAGVDLSFCDTNGCIMMGAVPGEDPARASPEQFGPLHLNDYFYETVDYRHF